MLKNHFRVFFKACKSREEVAMVYVQLTTDISSYPGTDEEKAHVMTIMDEISQEFEHLPYETDYLETVKNNAH